MKVVDALAPNGAERDPAVEAEALAEVRKLTDAHPARRLRQPFFPRG